MRIINCENPVLILNPRLSELLAKYGHYSMFGRTHRIIHRMKVLNQFEARMFHPRNNGVTIENMDECFVYDDETGETFPMYLAVPCNHCTVCKGAKINSFVHRCKLESQCYDSLPWFCTLTYDCDFLPSEGVSVREMQLFMKRFRINLKRAGFSFRPRYVIVGEYGRKTHRPHYHAIFWNLDTKSDLDYLKVSDILRSSWNKGFIQRRVVNLQNDRCFYYTSKYMRKDCVVPKGMNPTFILSSRGKGGIGSRFIDKVSEEVRRTLNTSFKFLNKWTGKVEDLCFCSYVVNRIFPSFCRSVPKSFRDAWSFFQVCLSQLKYNNEFYSYKKLFQDEFKCTYFDFYVPFREKVKAFLFCPSLSKELSGSLPLQPLSVSLSLLSSLREELSNFNLSSLPFFWEIQKKREAFVSKMVASLPVVDLSVKSFNLRKQFALAAARENF